MGMTISEKILAAHAGLDSVEPGQLVDAKLLEAKRQLQEARTAQNQAGKKIAQLKGDDKQAAIDEMADLKHQAKQLGDEIAELEPRFDELILRVPQPAAAEVPVGADESENVELRREGEIPTFDFEPKDHMQLGEALDIIDVPRGVKLAGTRNLAEYTPFSVSRTLRSTTPTARGTRP